jgi:hypothetical protein
MTYDMSKAILIDPNVPIVDEVDIDLDSLPAIYKVIGCSSIEGYPINNGDWMLIDEEAKLLDNPTPTFLLKGFHDVICGRALVIGLGAEGASVSPKATLLDIADLVVFQ